MQATERLAGDGVLSWHQRSARPRCRFACWKELRAGGISARAVFAGECWCRSIQACHGQPSLLKALQEGARMCERGQLLAFCEAVSRVTPPPSTALPAGSSFREV